MSYWQYIYAGMDREALEEGANTIRITTKLLNKKPRSDDPQLLQGAGDTDSHQAD